MFICSNFSFFLLLFKVLWPPVKFFNPPVLHIKKHCKSNISIRLFALCLLCIPILPISFYFILCCKRIPIPPNTLTFVQFSFNFILFTVFFFIQFKNTIDPIAEIIMKIKLTFVSDTHRRVVKSNTLRN